MPKLDLNAVPGRTGYDYPSPFDQPVRDCFHRELAPAAGIADFEVNHVVLPPGVWSSQRHWHEGEDEFLVMVAGSATLIDDRGETALAAGDCVAFPKNDGNGHRLVGGPDGATFVVVGIKEASPCHYPDIDLLYDGATGATMHRDGTPY